jgi:hypothetical protein
MRATERPSYPIHPWSIHPSIHPSSTRKKKKKKNDLFVEETKR